MAILEVRGLVKFYAKNDHLGLTIETVSRTIAELARDGVIGRPGRARTFALRDLAALRHLSC